MYSWGNTLRELPVLKAGLVLLFGSCPDRRSQIMNGLPYGEDFTLQKRDALRTSPKKYAVTFRYKKYRC